MRQTGHFPNFWEPVSLEISDATGNRVSGMGCLYEASSRQISKSGVYDFQGDIPTGESA